MRTFSWIWLAIVLASPFVVLGEDSQEDSDSPGALVGTKKGKIQGLVRTSRNGNKYFTFLGVPYGKVPERFGLPQEVDSWAGVKKAVKKAPHCIQFCLMEERIVGVEDCLTMNIYSRKLDGKLPVMVLLHGGGFQFGSGSFHDAKYFMDEEIVLVTIQYRLGALGFLNTEDDVVSGNMGLRDQSFALKWIQDNIENFGGDRTKVTIFGYSAGGASVHYQMLSPMSKGLFSHAISQSGTALNPWAFQSRPKALAERLALDLKCSIETTKKMVDCLKEKTPAEIITAQLKFSKFPHEFDLISMLFCPSVERGSLEPKFISDTPYTLTANGFTASKVPWMVGVTADEGAFYTATMIENGKSLKTLDTDWYKMLPNILYYENSASPATQSRVSGMVRDFYFPDGKITKEHYKELGQVFGDRFFVVGVSRAIREYAKNPQFPIYPYIFNYTGTHSIVEGMLHAKQAYGVAHADELKYMFNQSYLSPEYGLDTQEGKFSQQLLKLYLSFARDGKPTELWGSAKSWEPFRLFNTDDDEETPAPISWYVIDEDTKVLKEDVFKNRTDFWESLPLRENEKEDWAEEKDEL